MATIGNTLKREIEKYADSLIRLNPLFLTAKSGALNASQIKTYVSGLLFQIRGTLEVLRRAERSALRVGDHALASHYRQKYVDERDHDQWALRDLARLGATGAEYGEVTPQTAIGELVTYLHSVVERDPCLFLSYILLAEYLTVLAGPTWLRVLEDKCGISSAKISVVANHVELDRDHVVAGVREIDALVTPDKTAAMLDVLRTSLSYYEQFWSEILATSTKAA